MIDFSRVLITFTTYLWLDKQDRQNSTKIFFFFLQFENVNSKLNGIKLFLE